MSSWSEKWVINRLASVLGVHTVAPCKALPVGNSPALRPVLLGSSQINFDPAIIQDKAITEDK